MLCYGLKKIIYSPIMLGRQLCSATRSELLVFCSPIQRTGVRTGRTDGHQLQFLNSRGVSSVVLWSLENVLSSCLLEALIMYSFSLSCTCVQYTLKVVMNFAARTSFGLLHWKRRTSNLSLLKWNVKILQCWAGMWWNNALTAGWWCLVVRWGYVLIRSSNCPS